MEKRKKKENDNFIKELIESGILNEEARSSSLKLHERNSTSSNNWSSFQVREAICFYEFTVTEVRR